MHSLFPRLLLPLVLFLLQCAPAFAGDSSLGPGNAEIYGFWTLVPPLVAISLAFITKNVILSLFIGVFSGTFMLEAKGFEIYNGFVHGFLRLTGEILSSLADPWNAGIVLQCLAIGGLIALVSRMGGAKAIAEALARKAKTPRSSQFVTWVLGLLIFFDDYANSLTVGPIMRPVTDRMRVSREKLAFIIDATAAPIAGIALISTWVAYEIGLIRDGFVSIGIETNAYGVFVETIPYRFYNIFILVFILATIFLLREFGPMHTAERRARTTGKLLDDNAKPMIADEATGLEPEPDVRLSIWNAIIPIGTLILAAFLGFYFNGYNGIMGGEDADLIALLKDSPMSFTAIREAFGASDASVVLFQAALIAGIVAMTMGGDQAHFHRGKGPGNLGAGREVPEHHRRDPAAGLVPFRRDQGTGHRLLPGGCAVGGHSELAAAEHHLRAGLVDLLCHGHLLRHHGHSHAPGHSLGLCRGPQPWLRGAQRGRGAHGRDFRRPLLAHFGHDHPLVHGLCL